MSNRLIQWASTAGLLASTISIAILASRPAPPAALAAEILRDPHLPHVLEMSRNLLRENLTAGEGYREVWIRDLNTFIEVALEVNPHERLRRALATFFAFQGPDGDIPDGFVPVDQANPNYTSRSSALAPGLVAHKNTVETDQESSLVQAVAKYVQVTGDRTILDEAIGGETVRLRLARALDYVRAARFDRTYGLVWGATSADWGDLQPEGASGTDLDATSHRAIDVYDNAMFVIAVNDYLQLVGEGAPDAASWMTLRDEVTRNVRKSVWDAARGQFIPHLYIDAAGSPFPASFDERAMYVHGGTAVAIEAGFLARTEVADALERMRADVRAAGAGSIGLSIYPPYPDGAFARPGMSPFMYQNGGDWCWFGGRMVQQLVRQGLVAEAYRELLPMVVRVERAGDFAEWWTRDSQPRGSGQFRGSAGVLGRAIEMLQTWATAHEPASMR